VKSEIRSTKSETREALSFLVSDFGFRVSDLLDEGEPMARCERGYLCAVCGHEVPEIIVSALYLRYVLGDVPAEQLHLLPEQHIVCDPALAQYIIDPGFPPVVCEGVFDKRTLDAEFVAREEARVTRGWQRLQGLPGSGLTLLEYPLPEVQAASGSYCSGQ
jgi:hypothetical protein